MDGYLINKDTTIEQLKELYFKYSLEKEGINILTIDGAIVVTLGGGIEVGNSFLGLIVGDKELEAIGAKSIDGGDLDTLIEVGVERWEKGAEISLAFLSEEVNKRFAKWVDIQKDKAIANKWANKYFIFLRDFLEENKRH